MMKTGKLALIICACAAATQAHAQFFGTRTDVPVAGAPTATARGDFNRDGRADLAIVRSQDGGMTLLINATSSQSAQFTQVEFPKPDTDAFHGVAAVDINEDGVVDLITTDGLTVDVYVNQSAPQASTPTFAAPLQLTTGSNPSYVAVGDLNGDGLPDIVIANESDNAVTVYRNTHSAGLPAASFAAPVTFQVGANPTSVAIADFDDDGRNDIITANLLDDSVSILLNQTASSIAPLAFAAQHAIGVGAEPFDVGVADLNGDGLPDFVAANNTDGNLSVFMNKVEAPGTFRTQGTIDVGPDPRSVALSDVDGDGKPDLIVGDTQVQTNQDSLLKVLINTTAVGADLLAVADPLSFAVGAAPSRIVLADIDHDGKLDVVTANVASATKGVTVLFALAAVTNPPPTDGGGSGGGGGALPLALLIVLTTGAFMRSPLLIPWRRRR